MDEVNSAVNSYVAKINKLKELLHPPLPDAPSK
jgi:hypothetical protein